MKKNPPLKLAWLAVVMVALTVSAQAGSILGGLPLYFEANQGQANVAAQFIARGPDSQFLISADGAQMALRKSTGEIAAVRMQFVGANPSAQIQGTAKLGGKINYLVGDDPGRWRSGIPTFGKVSVAGVYPGISLLYYGNQRRLEYDFTIAPGANPNAIAIRFAGPEKISVNAQGELVLNLGNTKIRQLKPLIYQTVDGGREIVEGGYKILDTHTVAFFIGQYDHALPLVIDPVLSLSTYFGGTEGDSGWAVAVNTNDGSIYVAGETLSKQFYNIAGSYQTGFGGGSLIGDAFVAKFSSSGQSLIYLTYLGGSADDGALGLAVDSAGDAFVTGFTDSTNFPTANAIYPHITGPIPKGFSSYSIDAFVAELDPGGSNLIYSTYLGGGAPDAAYGIAVDASGNAYVTGSTYSTNFPTTNSIQNHLACTYSQFYNANAFVAEIAPYGAGLVFSTYLGGTNFDQGQGIAVDGTGNIYVTGYTSSTNFPTYKALYPYLNGSTNKNNLGKDAFVVKFPPFNTWTAPASNQVYSISNLVYSTYLGGTNEDIGRGIACDAAGDALVTGSTSSTNFPNTATNVPGLYSFVATNRTTFIATNAFLTEINPDGSALGFSALFGGKGGDVGNGVALDPVGNIFVVGSTTSTNFPAYNVPGLMSSTNTGKSDVFVIGFTNTADALLYSGYLGGKSDDYGYGIAVDASGNAYITGQTLSTNFPTVHPGQSSRRGTSDAFFAKILLTVPPPEITTQPADQSASVGSTVRLSVAASGTGPFSYLWQFNGTNLASGGNIIGATNINTFSTSATLTITNAQVTNSGDYSVIVTNNGGSVVSSNAVLTVTNVPPAITVQPMDQTNGVGATVTLSVVATGTTPLSYQWQVGGTNLMDGGPKGGTVISGATSNVLQITKAQLTDSGIYSVIITNIAGTVTSSNVVLTIVTAPVFVEEPTNYTTFVGSTATFTALAAGTLPLSYHWKLNGTNLVNGGQKNGSTISGATTSALTIGKAQTANNGSYTLAVTNIAGSAISSSAVLTVTNIPPTIIIQPVSLTNGVGTTVEFGVLATGTAPLRYQWQLNGTNLVNGSHKNGPTISGATTNILKISNLQLTSDGNYTVIVTNFGGSVTSSNAVLTVYAAPVITVQPTNESFSAGATATLSVTAIGTIPLKYQWQLNGTNLVNKGSVSGAKTDVLKITNIQTNNSGIYTVVVTNVDGSAISSNAVVTVTNVPPTITVQPQDQGLAVGGVITLSVTATGTAPLSYFWQDNGTNLVNGGRISGATTDVLKIKTAQTNDSGTYTVIITNIAGSVTSSNAVVTVASSPVIITQPTNESFAVGQTATFVVDAVGTAPLSYQWQVNGTNLTNGFHLDGASVSGATSNVLVLFGLYTNDSGIYTVTVTNQAGSAVSSNAVLTVTNTPPTITVQPVNRTVEVGTTNVILSVTATGTAPLSYQWQLDGTNLLDEGAIIGSTSNQLTIAVAEATNSGTYTVVVTNIAGSATSSNAVLSVVFPPAFGGVVAPGDGSIIFNGSGGLSNATYYVLTSSNLATPFNLWTPIATNQFDDQGQFIFTNIPPTNTPQLFYLLQLQ